MEQSAESPEQPDSTPPQSESTPPASENKTVAIVAYLTIIGFIIAIVLNSKDKTALGSFHLRQMMGLAIGSIVCGFIPIVGLFSFFFFIFLWVMGLIAASSGQMKPVPLLGEKFDEWFKNVF
ncbi:hypothetical protein MLD52_03580 [Puniceicoccaceae bacterium K14]|nr:hypothetical protein [Puniceicoccaceae bacterium K14]